MDFTEGMESILTSIKKPLGMTKEYKIFDFDLIMHINSVFMTLHQMGVGPEDGFSIKDDKTTWSEYIPEDDKNFEAVKTYVYLKVKLIFDPPQSSSILENYKQLIAEYEWRLNLAAEQKRKGDELNG